jgi:hypothetical protein
MNRWPSKGGQVSIEGANRRVKWATQIEASYLGKADGSIWKYEPPKDGSGTWEKDLGKPIGRWRSK